MNCFLDSNQLQPLCWGPSLTSQNFIPSAAWAKNAVVWLQAKLSNADNTRQTAVSRTAPGPHRCTATHALASSLLSGQREVFGFDASGTPESQSE